MENVSLDATKFPSSLFRRYLQKYRSDGGKENFVGESFLWSFYSNDTFFVGVGSFRRFFRHLECVGFVDSIIDAVFDVVGLLVASNSLLLRSIFVRGE